MGIFELIPLIVIGSIFVAPIGAIIALIALSRVRKLSQDRDTPAQSNWSGRIAALEKRIGELSRGLDERGKGQAPPAAGAPSMAGQAAHPPAQPPPVAGQAPRPPAQAPPMAGQAASPQPSGGGWPTAPAPALKPPAPPSGGGGDFDLESLIAGRGLLFAGILALLIASAFFLKYAFENNWVGPTGKVAILMLVGAALLAYSQKLLDWGYAYFSSGVTALGGGVLYLSVYAAWDYYHLVGQEVAFAGMIAITAALVAIAIGRDSQVIAVYGLLGGYLTPFLVGTGVDAQVTLFSYLALLNAGMLVLTHARGWVALERLAFVATLIYFGGWYASFYDHGRILSTSMFATLFFAQFSALPILHSRRGDPLLGPQVALVLGNAAWFLATLGAMLYQNHLWELTFAVIALAAAYLAVARMIPLDVTADSEGAGGRTQTRLLFAGLALTFLTLAIGIRLEGEWVTIAWAVEGLVLMWTGFNIRTRMLRTAGFILFGITMVRLLSHLDNYWVTDAFLLNARFAVFAVSIVCFAASYFLSQKNPDELNEGEANAFKALALSANLFTLLILSVEIWQALERIDPGRMFAPGMAPMLGLSVLWIAYAGALIAVGAVTKTAIVRWQGLILMGVSIIKVFVLDSSFLSEGYRILSFFVLGVPLLAVSFYYQKYLREKKKEGGDKP